MKIQEMINTAIQISNNGNNYYTDSYLYIIKNIKGLIKIGVSISPTERIQKLSSSAGEKYTTIKIYLFNEEIDAKPYEVEKFLHSLFEKQRVFGEWFNLTNYQIAKALYIIENGFWLENIYYKN
jgi:DNA-binding transcriptional MerR regulator